jgi:formate hydrogenlyase transcriptional activator
MDKPASFEGSRAWTMGNLEAVPLSGHLEDDLLSAMRKLTATLDVDGVCEAVLTGVENVFGATSSWIMLHDAEANALRTQMFRGRGADVYGALTLSIDRGVAGLAFTRREIQFVPDVSADDRWFDPDRVWHSGLRSVFVLPLMGPDGPIGVLGIDAPHFGPAHPPAALDLKRLEVFAAQAANGIVNARLYETSQQDRARLRALLRERRVLRRHVVELREQVRDAYAFDQIVGQSEAIRRVLTELEQVASSHVTVLLLGETGTGKELLARALHERSGRRSRPFVPVNCAALPEHLVESEMFGHERGSFTGAHARKPGRFELAHRGTLFLDEIGDLPSGAQAKLLRVLQDGEVHRVGSTQPVKIDVRLVAATNQDLPARVVERAFREDLYYRLSVFPIRVPPLRERPDDIPLLASHVATRFAARIGKRVSGIEDGALERLQGYAWPGNVRELQNVIERAVILTAGPVVTAEVIRLEPPVAAPTAGAAPAGAPAPSCDTPSRPRTLADAERAAIIQALRAAEGRVSGEHGAAAKLGLRPTTLHAKMKKLGVRRADALKPI